MASNDCEPKLICKLARSHGWSEFVDVAELASDAAVADEREARRVAREQLSERDYIVYRQDTDRIKFGRPQLDQAAIDLSEYGYSDLKIAATFGDQQDILSVTSHRTRRSTARRVGTPSETQQPINTCDRQYTIG